MRTLLAACIIASVALAPASPAVSVTVRPTIMLQRGDIHVVAHVPRAATNRILVIAWDSNGGSVGETMRQIDGEDAPTTFDLWLRDQPAARYEFVATLFNDKAKVAGRDIAIILVPE